MGFQLGDIIYTDHIAAYKYSTSKDQPKTLSISIGDDTAEEDLVTQGLRLVNNVWNAIAALAGQTNIFN